MVGGPECIFFGAGIWGRKVIRSFVAAGAVPRGFLCQPNTTTAASLSTEYPNVRVGFDAERILRQEPASVVVIATPRETHAEFAELALRAGRDVFVEKPMALDPATCRRLIAIAERQRLALFTGFTFLYHGAYSRLRAAINPSDLTSLNFNWTRPNLNGPAEWELLPHELALAIGLSGEVPQRISIQRDGQNAECLWQTTSGIDVRVKLDVGREPKSKTVCAATRRGEFWRWEDNRLTMKQPQSGYTDAILDVSFPLDEPLLREVMWFLNNRRNHILMRADWLRSAAVTSLIANAVEVQNGAR